MTSASLLACSSAVILVLSLNPDISRAQTWSYQGNSVCYNFSPSMSQCYAHGTIQRYASSQEQFDAQFKAGWAAGEGIGSLVNLLMSKWAEHRKLVQQERSDLRAQLNAYASANDELSDEWTGELNVLIELTPQLAKFVPSVADKSDSTVAFYRKVVLDLEKQKIDSKKNLTIILGAKDRNFLRGCLQVEQKRYENLRVTVARGYVFTEFVKAAIGFNEHADNLVGTSQ